MESGYLARLGPFERPARHTCLFWIRSSSFGLKSLALRYCSRARFEACRCCGSTCNEHLEPRTDMSALRASRAALRARSALTKNPAHRRGYADAVSDKIKLSLALPHQVRPRQWLFPRLEKTDRSRMMGVSADMGYSRLSTNLQMCTTPLPPLANGTATDSKQCASEPCGRVGRDGYTSTTRSVDRAAEAWVVRDHRRSRWQQTILS